MIPTSGLTKLFRAAALAGSLLLSACGNQTPTAIQPEASDSGYILTVKTEGRSQSEVAQTYNGQILSWDDQANLALLKVATLNQAAVAAQYTTVPATPDSKMISPAVQGSGWNAWSGGWNAWSSGWNAWSGGWNAWSGGTTLPAYPSDNNSVFMQIRLPQAHAISRNFGAGIKVAVIDTGVDTAHPGFSGDLVPSSEWRDYIDNDNNPQEVSGNAYGHGTAVAGIILQVAPRVKILPIRVLDGSGGGSLSSVITAIDYAISMGARVINVSLGSDQPFDPLFTVLDKARRNGVYVVASAGNFGAKDKITFPGQMAYWYETSNLWRDTRGYVFGVGSLNTNDALSSFTSRGADLALTAPGESIASFGPASRTFRVTGTSFAGPLVAGSIALAMSETSSSNWGQIGRFLSQRGVLETQSLWWRHYRSSRSWCDVTTSIDGSQWCHGNGRLDVENLIRSLPGWTQPTPRVGMDAVVNGNFEAGSVNWQLSNAVVGVSGGNPEIFIYSQRQAARLNAGGSINQTVTGLKANTTYTITAWAHVSWTGETGVMGVRNHGQAERSQTINNTQDSLGGNYVRQSMSFTTGSSSTSAQIFFNKPTGTGGPMMIDRVSVTEGSTVY